MSISDIKDELSTIRENLNNSLKQVNNNELSPIKIIKINSIEQIETLINSKIVNIYQRPWSKLETKLKKNRIREYLDTLLSEKKIDKQLYNDKLYIYNNTLDLNRKLKVEYDDEHCKIKNIL